MDPNDTGISDFVDITNKLNSLDYVHVRDCEARKRRLGYGTLSGEWCPHSFDPNKVSISYPFLVSGVGGLSRKCG